MEPHVKRRRSGSVNPKVELGLDPVGVLVYLQKEAQLESMRVRSPNSPSKE